MFKYIFIIIYIGYFMSTKNITTSGMQTANGVLRENLPDGGQLDAGFADLGSFFQYLDQSDGYNNIINETVLDNLYTSVTEKSSDINFSERFGGKDGKVNTKQEFKTVLSFLESQDTQNVFGLVEIQGEKKELGIIPTEIKVVSPVPQSVIDKYQLDNSTGFYDKMVIARGIPVFASDNTTDEQIIKAGETINKVLLNSPKLQAIYKADNHKVILTAPGKGELNTIPGIIINKGAYSAFGKDKVGFHATAPSDTGENRTLIHELFGHGSAAHLSGKKNHEALYPNFFKELETLFKQEKSKFGGDHPSNNPSKTDENVDYWYAGANSREFWAEVVSMYFGATPTQSRVPPYSGPEDLKKISPATYNLVHSIFGPDNKITQ